VGPGLIFRIETKKDLRKIGPGTGYLVPFMCGTESKLEPFYSFSKSRIGCTSSK
jgi:hypothetical protein